MGNGSAPSLSPRKTPSQGRSVATVEAIIEATIHILTGDERQSLTTTRVANRAGVSVGTFYQYFPNKQALLFTIVELHLRLLSETLEKECAGLQGAKVEEIAQSIVHAYLDAQMRQAKLSPSLYRISVELDARKILETTIQQGTETIAKALSRSSDGGFANPYPIARTLIAVLYGTVPAFCPKVLSKADRYEAEKQLTVMFNSYLNAAERQG